MKRNILVAHGGGPTTVINASLFGVIDEAMRQSSSGKVFGAIHGVEGVLNDELIELSSQDQKQLVLLPYTPASAIGSCRRKLTDADYPRILEVLKKHDIGCFFYNGGNDSMDTCNKIAKLAEASGYDLAVIGIPKTIDNDLALTDHCPGYGSAARFIANNTRDLWMEVRAMPMHVTIMETMGRNAGWLTAAGSIPDYDGKPCAQLVYLPEYAFDENAFLADVDNLLHKQREILIVVSEGLADENGKMIADLGIVDGFGHKLAGGAAQALCDKVTARLGVRARAERHGFLGRCSMIMQSAQDREEAIAVGRHAVRLAFSGHTGLMAAIRRDSDHPYAWSLTEVPLENVANLERKFPLEWINQGRNGITDEFRAYALPLIGEPLPPYAVLSGR